MKDFFLLICLLTGTFSVAQDYDSDSVFYTPIEKQKHKIIKLAEEKKDSKTVEYFFDVRVGSLIGCNACHKGKEFTFTAATVHGVLIGEKFRTGIGLGFDAYQNWQALPVYGMASWDLIGNKNRNALFLQMAYGWAHPWFVRSGVYSNDMADPFSHVKGGRMINPQIGYRIKYYELKIAIAIGYKYQRIFYEHNLCPACSPQQTTVDQITQEMNRVQLVMSVGWK